MGGDLVDAITAAIDRMLTLNINVVRKNVHDVLPHMIARGSGDTGLDLRAGAGKVLTGQHRDAACTARAQ